MCTSDVHQPNKKRVPIQVGDRFGYWEFLENIGHNKGKFLCHNCNKEYSRQISAIRSGKSRMCFPCNLAINLVNTHNIIRENTKKFGNKTTVLKPGERYNYWEFVKSLGGSKGAFLCTRCGTTHEKLFKTIKNGKTLACKSCTKELKQANKQPKEKRIPKMVSLKLGERYGLWEFREALSNGRGMVKCTGCNRTFDRLINPIINHVSNSCIQCAGKARRNKTLKRRNNIHLKSDIAARLTEPTNPIDIISINESYGLKTVISIDEENKKVLLQCSCGHRSTVSLHYFYRAERTTKCKHCSKKRKTSVGTLPIGYRSGWLVLKKKTGQNTGIFLCEGCDKKIERKLSNVKIARTNSCIDCRTKYKREKNEEQNRRRQALLNN
jgi:hypothetical protein